MIKTGKLMRRSISVKKMEVYLLVLTAPHSMKLQKRHKTPGQPSRSFQQRDIRICSDEQTTSCVRPM